MIHDQTLNVLLISARIVTHDIDDESYFQKYNCSPASRRQTPMQPMTALSARFAVQLLIFSSVHWIAMNRSAVKPRTKSGVKLCVAS